MEKLNPTANGITQDQEHAKASVAFGVLMFETVSNEQAVKEVADEIETMLEKEFKGTDRQMLTILAALLNIAMEHAGDYLTPELVALAQSID